MDQVKMPSHSKFIHWSTFTKLAFNTKYTPGIHPSPAWQQRKSLQICKLKIRIKLLNCKISSKAPILGQINQASDHCLKYDSKPLVRVFKMKLIFHIWALWKFTQSCRESHPLCPTDLWKFGNTDYFQSNHMVWNSTLTSGWPNISWYQSQQEFTSSLGLHLNTCLFDRTC